MTTSVTRPRNSMWLIVSLVSGLVVGVPAGWFLEHLVLLPMFLGMFFFMLFGLLIGAIMFRFGKSAAPVPKTTLWLIGCTVTMVIWASGLVTEYLEFPGKVAQEIRRDFSRSFTKTDLTKLHEETRLHIKSRLATDYYPGGFLGYLRWAAVDGTIGCPRVFNDSTFTYELPQRKSIWLARVILSLALLAFTILSQVLCLTKVPSPDSNTPLAKDYCK